MARDTTLYGNLEDCGVFFSGSVIGCFVVILYFVFVSVPSWLMGMTAGLFDYMATLTISSTMYTATFIEKIWVIVRDFANIFFILVLLYAAFQIILDIGHGGGKKIVGTVIIVALLVNFSLFTTKVIIDSSNVLALIFYNKVACLAKDNKPCSSTAIADPAKTGIQQRDLAAALTSSFDVNSFYKGDFFKGLPANDFANEGQSGRLTRTLAISLIIMYGLIAYSLAWIFLVVGLSFLSRMITLMLLMIVSPLAFVTAAVPGMKGINTIGFSSWMKQLIQVSFVATIFMAILYLVSEILKADIFTNASIGTANQDMVARLLLIFIPALLIIILLKKGSSYAEKASGEFTGAIMGGAKMLGGFALGAVTGGAAVALRGTLGSGAARVANDDNLKAKAAAGDKGAQRKLALANSMSKWSFDARKTQAGGLVQKQTGMNLQTGTKMFGLDSAKLAGGRKAQTERTVAKHEKKVQSYQLSKSASMKQDARGAEYQKDLAEAQAKAAPADAAKKAAWDAGADAEVTKAKAEKMKTFETLSPDEEKAIREEYAKTSPPPGVFNESKFKEAYVAGDKEALKKEFGTEKGADFKAGEVGTAKDVNQGRRDAYAQAIEDKANKQEARGQVRTFWDEWKKGSKEMFTTVQGASITAGATAIAGPLGTVIAGIGGGFLSALKSHLGVTGEENMEVAAAVRKGVDPNKKFMDDITKLMKGGDHKAAEEVKKAAAAAAASSAGGDKKDDSGGGEGGDAHH